MSESTSCEQEECQNQAAVLTTTVQRVPMWLCGKCAMSQLQKLSQEEEDNGKMRPVRTPAT